MQTINEFLSENMPLDYRACFTLRIKNNCARIAGSIAVCDAIGNIIAREDNIECEPQMLIEAALRLNRCQPDIGRLSEAVKNELANILKEDMAVGY